ncbi:MAG TPA: hypothetical protein VIU14_04215, partial [Mesorhizobium sp.]
MSTENIREHFVRFLGADVSVAFAKPESPRIVLIYRPNRLSDHFVLEAFEELAESDPALAAQIERLAVSFETRLGRTRGPVTRRRVMLPRVVPQKPADHTAS